MYVLQIFQIIRCARDRRKRMRHRLSKKQLKQLLTTIYTKGTQYDICAICLDEYMEGERLRVLPCGHCYHSRCIDKWLTKQKARCCVCKTKVRIPGMRELSDSEEDGEPVRIEPTYVSSNESTPLLRDQRSSLWHMNQAGHATTSTGSSSGNLNRDTSNQRPITRGLIINESNRVRRASIFSVSSASSSSEAHA